MRAIERRAAEIVVRARGRRARQIAEQLRNLLPDADVEERGSTIEVAATALRKRWLNNTALRFLPRTFL